MNILISIYIIFFVVWSVLGSIESLKSGYPKQVLVMDIFVSVLASVGMVIYLLQMANLTLVSLWKVIFFLIVFWEIRMAFLDYQDSLKNPDPELSPDENRKGGILGMCLGIALLIPCFIINYVLAFG